MLTELDDYLCHQTVEAIEYPYTSDYRFYSRHFITFYDSAGTFAGIVGMGCYPNSEVMDGFAILALEGKTQRNLRVSRKLDHDPHVTTVGPVRIEIVDPLRALRIVCDENLLGFGYDIVCESVTPPFERPQRFLGRVHGRVAHRTCHFNQGYTCRGTITVDGRAFSVTPDRWFGVRDVSWGVRHHWEPFGHGGAAKTGGAGQGDFAPGRALEVGTIGQGQGRGQYGQGDFPVGGRFQPHNIWLPFAAGEGPRYLTFTLYPPSALTGGALVYPWGDSRPEVRLVGIERKNVVFSERPRRFESCELVCTDERGERSAVEVRRLSTVYEGAGGYLDLGTGFEMGKPTGTLHVEGESWDTAPEPPPAATKSVSAHFCEMRWGERVGYGMFEVIDEGLRSHPYARFIPPSVVTEEAK